MSAIHLSAATWGKTQIMVFLKEFFKKQAADDFRFDDDESVTKVMILSKAEVNYETINAIAMATMLMGVGNMRKYRHSNGGYGRS